MEGSGHLKVTIHAGDSVAQGVLEPAPRSRGQQPGATAARLRAPLWALSLGRSVTVELPDGSHRRVRVLDVTGMQGPVATVNVELADGPHRTMRPRATSDPTPTRRPSPA